MNEPNNGRDDGSIGGEQRSPQQPQSPRWYGESPTDATLAGATGQDPTTAEPGGAGGPVWGSGDPHPGGRQGSYQGAAHPQGGQPQGGQPQSGYSAPGPFAGRPQGGPQQDGPQASPAYGAYGAAGQPNSGQALGAPDSGQQPNSGQAFGAPGSGTKTKHPRRRYELPAVALLAALLASGATYGASQLGNNGSGTDTATGTSQSTAAPVVQATGSSPDWSATAKAVSPSVVAIKVSNGQQGAQGSGVIIDKEGHVVTNNHVAVGGGQGAKITVSLSDKRTYEATVVGADPLTDLTVLQIKGAPDDLTPISMGNSDKLGVGDPVMAVGNPLGLAGTVTTGIVSALNRPVTTQGESSAPGGGEPVVTNAVQTSAAINPGNSGGALVTDSGQLIGINSSIPNSGSQVSGGQSGNIGIGFAIPVNEVRSIADQLITSGKAQHAYLGVTAQDTVVQNGSAKLAAAKLHQVNPDTPASKAGLQAGDAVIALNGHSISSSLSLVAQVHEYTPGDKVKLTVVHDGKRQDVTVTLGSK